MQAKLIVAIVVIGASLGFGCDRSEQSPDTNETTVTGALDRPTTPSASTSATPGLAPEDDADDADQADPVVFETHPWPAEYHQLVATVVSEHSVEYRTEPDRNAAISARQTLQPDTRISFADSQTHVRKPFVAKATRAVKVSGATASGDSVEQDLVPGDAYEAYLYAGEGMCHAKIADQMAVGDCPDRQHFQAANWTGQAPLPEAFDLWLKTRKGWMLVDLEAVDLKSVSTL